MSLILKNNFDKNPFLSCQKNAWLAGEKRVKKNESLGQNGWWQRVDNLELKDEVQISHSSYLYICLYWAYFY